MKRLPALLLLAFATLIAEAAPLVYEGTAGAGKGKQIVFIASDRDANISFAGLPRPTWLGRVKRAAHVKPDDLAGWDAPIWPEEMGGK